VTQIKTSPVTAQMIQGIATLSGLRRNAKKVESSFHEISTECNELFAFFESKTGAGVACEVVLREKKTAGLAGSLSNAFDFKSEILTQIVLQKYIKNYYYILLLIKRGRCGFKAGLIYHYGYFYLSLISLHIQFGACSRFLQGHLSKQ
jgi:hypothetical protein